MKNLIKLLIFLIYTVVIFVTSNYYILGIYMLLNFIMMILLKVDFRKSTNNIIFLLPFIIFTGAINLIFSDINSTSLVIIRLILVCNITYSFKYVLSSMQIANAIETMCFPLKVFKINTKDISLVICICIAFIPILSKELGQIKYALKSKGLTMKFKNFKYILKPFLYGTFKRVNEVSNALKAKAYVEE